MMLPCHEGLTVASGGLHCSSVELGNIRDNNFSYDAIFHVENLSRLLWEIAVNGGEENARANGSKGSWGNILG